MRAMKTVKLMKPALLLKPTVAVMAPLVAAMLMSSPVAAYEAGDWLVRAGVAHVAPNDDSDGVAVPVIGVPAIAGTGVSVDGDSQLGLTATYMVTSTWGVELLAATPFSHDISANLGGLGTVAVGEATQLPPTLSAIWYPLGSDKKVSPYVGAGINYTIFFEEDASSALEAATPAVVTALGGPTLAGPVPMDLDLDNSLGFAAQLGVDIALNEQWHVNGSIRWIDLDTKATLTSALGTTITVDNVDVDPWVYQLNIGYRF